MQPGTQSGLHVAGQAGHTLDHTGAAVLPANSESTLLSDRWSRELGDLENNLGSTFDERRGGQEFDNRPKLTDFDSQDLRELTRLLRQLREDRRWCEFGDTAQLGARETIRLGQKVCKARIGRLLASGNILLIGAPVRGPDDERSCRAVTHRFLR